MILVSNSPRRREILSNAGFEFSIISANISEDYPNHMSIEEIPLYLAERKAKSVHSKNKNEILIACDTIVVLNNTLIGKPKDEKDAGAILRMISGKVHKVISGVCILYRERKILFNDETLVFFKELNDKQIEFYIRNFKPFDKAGAYGIQEWIGIIGVERIEGSFYNVMGLPIHRVYKELKALQHSINK